MSQQENSQRQELQLGNWRFGDEKLEPASIRPTDVGRDRFIHAEQLRAGGDVTSNSHSPTQTDAALSVTGLVRNPQQLSLSNVLALPRESQVSRMKCVECWSAAAKWEGFHLRSILEIADPKPEVKWVHFQCADGYYESTSLEALLPERVLLVHHMNDNILPDIYGAPLRLMVPFLYGYKSAKAIVSMEFAAEELPGYWPTVGPYTTHGNIRRGQDHPLDLEGTRQIAGGSEIFYPDGIEFKD